MSNVISPLRPEDYVPTTTTAGTVPSDPDSVVRLEKGAVYRDLVDGEYFVCIDAEADSQGDCHVMNFDGSDGFALSECSDYLKLAPTINDFLFSISTDTTKP